MPMLPWWASSTTMMSFSSVTFDQAHCQVVCLGTGGREETDGEGFRKRGDQALDIFPQVLGYEPLCCDQLPHLLLAFAHHLWMAVTNMCRAVTAVQVLHVVRLV